MKERAGNPGCKRFPADESAPPSAGRVPGQPTLAAFVSVRNKQPVTARVLSQVFSRGVINNFIHHLKPQCVGSVAELEIL